MPLTGARTGRKDSCAATKRGFLGVKGVGDLVEKVFGERIEALKE